jgi:hypothetical protein
MTALPHMAESFATFQQQPLGLGWYVEGIGIFFDN